MSTVNIKHKRNVGWIYQYSSLHPAVHYQIFVLVRGSLLVKMELHVKMTVVEGTPVSVLLDTRAQTVLNYQ